MPKKLTRSVLVRGRCAAAQLVRTASGGWQVEFEGQQIGDVVDMSDGRRRHWRAVPPGRGPTPETFLSLTGAVSSLVRIWETRP